MKVGIKKVAPKTLDQKREFLKREIEKVDADKQAVKDDLHAVSTNRIARSRVRDMPLFIKRSHERIQAYNNKRTALVHALSRVNAAIKNRNREKSGRSFKV